MYMISRGLYDEFDAWITRYFPAIHLYALSEEEYEELVDHYWDSFMGEMYEENY